jgi:hypothetical protein
MVRQECLDWLLIWADATSRQFSTSIRLRPSTDAFLSLLTSVGGFDLVLTRIGLRCVGQVELDPVPRSILARHFPEVARHDDVRTTIAWRNITPRPCRCRKPIAGPELRVRPVLYDRDDRRIALRLIYLTSCQLLRGLPCWRAARRPTTPSCWYPATRWRCCAELGLPSRAAAATFGGRHGLGGPSPG